MLNMHMSRLVTVPPTQTEVAVAAETFVEYGILGALVILSGFVIRQLWNQLNVERETRTELAVKYIETSLGIKSSLDELTGVLTALVEATNKSEVQSRDRLIALSSKLDQHVAESNFKNEIRDLLDKAGSERA